MVSRTYVFDLDGCIADARRRLPLFRVGFDEFYEDMENDPVITPMRQIMTGMYESSHLNNIVILTGREERVRGRTSIWLARNSVPYDVLMMRPNGYRGTVQDMKINALRTLMAASSPIQFVVEDNILTAEAISKELGLPVLNVYSGYYESGHVTHTEENAFTGES